MIHLFNFIDILCLGSFDIFMLKGYLSCSHVIPYSINYCIEDTNISNTFFSFDKPISFFEKISCFFNMSFNWLNDFILNI